MDALVVAVRPGTIVRPAYGGRFPVVGRLPRKVGLAVPAVKGVRSPHLIDAAQAQPEILVVPRGEKASAAATKRVDALHIPQGEAVVGVGSEEPHLVVERLRQRGKDGVVTVPVRLTIPAIHRVTAVAEMSGEQRESAYVPIVFRERDGRLQQDTYRTFSGSHRVPRNLKATPPSLQTDVQGEEQERPVPPAPA